MTAPTYLPEETGYSPFIPTYVDDKTNAPAYEGGGGSFAGGGASGSWDSGSSSSADFSNVSSGSDSSSCSSYCGGSGGD